MNAPAVPKLPINITLSMTWGQALVVVSALHARQQWICDRAAATAEGETLQICVYKDAARLLRRTRHDIMRAVDPDYSLGEPLL